MIILYMIFYPLSIYDPFNRGSIQLLSLSGTNYGYILWPPLLFVYMSVINRSCFKSLFLSLFLKKGTKGKAEGERKS